MADFRRWIAALMMLAAIPVQAQRTDTITAVSPPAVTNLGSAVVGTAGTTLNCYWVVANYVGGGIISSPTCLSNVPNTLSSSNYVQISWAAATGSSVTYDVLKTTSTTPPTAGASSSLTTGLTATTYNDQGGSLSAYTITNFTYSTSSAILQLNNRDYAVPAYEIVGSTTNPIEGALGYIVPKVGDNLVRLGSRSTPVTIDNTGAMYITNGSAVPGSPVGTTIAGAIFSASANITLAQVNAGYTLVPAVTGQTYKLQHAVIQAKGGDTAGCTAVQIDDTAGTPIVGVSAAIAALTQDTVVNEATASGVTVTTLAPTAFTASQGIQVIKTGSACTTATSFNVIVFYTINS